MFAVPVDVAAAREPSGNARNSQSTVGGINIRPTPTTAIEDPRSPNFNVRFGHRLFRILARGTTLKSGGRGAVAISLQVGLIYVPSTVP